MANKKGSFIKYGSVISYDISDDQKDAIIDILMEYYKKNCHFGEGIHQDDNSILDAPSVLSDICDNIISFEESSEH